jgi:AcrR family transcriptional regulator
VSRDAVLAAAKRRFAEQGYEKTTLRDIAHDAHVDASMVLYLFGSKADLFRESLKLILDPTVLTAAIAGDQRDVGARLVRAYLQMWEHAETRPSLVSMLQSATSNPDAHEAFRGFVQSYVSPIVSEAFGGGEQARLRAMLTASQLVGMAMLRYVMEVAPMATLSGDEIVTLIGPTIQRYVTAPAEELGLPDL